ncbi:hypothetical protein LWI28_020114 [Acer negundo]|uniref:Pentatricopeptide repeat-containing protein n=1 Tax=Acer negundo TaxID=4023 RepID=A0AAD5NUH9_ACENE|nr:hypothetical protein LWI28_020114 [Acer negundo]
MNHLRKAKTAQEKQNIREGQKTQMSTALIGFYRKIESLSEANKLFAEIPQPSVVSWNSLISRNVQSGKYPLVACGQLGLLQLGKSIQSKIVEYGMECGGVVANFLIGMYGKCGLLEDAVSVFNKMVDKDIISWNSVIAARNHDLEQAFRFFYQLPNPDTISYNKLINGIAQFGNMKEAIEILSIMLKPNSSS